MIFPRQIVCLLVFAVLSLFVSVGFSQQATDSVRILSMPTKIDLPAKSNCPFSIGEKLKFDITCFFSKVGSMELTFWGLVDHEGNEYFRVTTYSQGLGMKDWEEIFACPDEWLPVLVRRDVIKAGIKSRIIENYDQEAFRVVVAPEGKEPSEIIDGKEKMQNVILLYYLFRMMQFDTGQQYQINLPREAYQVNVGEVEKLTVPSGEYQARALTSDPKRFTVWITADENPLPAKMVLKTNLGTYTFSLASREIVTPQTAQSERPSTLDSLQ